MISLVRTLPNLDTVSAELIKIHCLYDCYKNDNHVLFWSQDENKALISMTDGNMIIHNNSADLEELKEFVDVLSPACVFSDYDTLLGLHREPSERINVMWRECDLNCDTESDNLSSKEI